ncbi:TPA: hypothetical protein ACXNP2_000029 [Stenotrophomonas maltophilia]
MKETLVDAALDAGCPACGAVGHRRQTDRAWPPAWSGQLLILAQFRRSKVRDGTSCVQVPARACRQAVAATCTSHYMAQC